MYDLDLARVSRVFAWIFLVMVGTYVVFESEAREFQLCLYISHYHENITAIIHLYYKEITRTPTLECTLECYEKLNSRCALEHRYCWH